jgi:BMFP domain-containing protein YqiC
MTNRSNIVDEFARLVTDAAGMAAGMRREVDTVVRTQLERLLASMDAVNREEFEAVKEMAARARDENDRLAARIAELESKLAAK